MNQRYVTEPELHELSAGAILSIHAASDAPDPGYGTPNLLIHDLLVIRRSAKMGRKLSRHASGGTLPYLQITSLITINSEKIMVSFWLALAEIVGEKVAVIHADAYCRQLAWLYGRQIELLDMLQADGTGLEADG